MKKSIKISLIVLAAVIALSLVISGVVSLIFKDKISVSTKNIITDFDILLNHTTEKGETLEIPFGWDASKIDENTYHVTATLNNNRESPNYKIENVRITANLDANVNIYSAFYGSGNSNYHIPNMDFTTEDERNARSYSGGTQKNVKCFSENGYMHIEMVLSGEELNSLSFDISYDVMGQGLYSNNKFHYAWEEMEFALEPPESAEQ